MKKRKRGEDMVRRLTLLLMLAVLLIPGGAFALGLGEIHLKSALNQAFDARIDLLSVKADELDGIKITLASPEAFERAGVDRLFILTKLRYAADLDDNGQPVIHVTSRQAIREPFLNFLIEVNWAKGRLVREYTVLLDPPVTLDRKPAPVSVPVTAAPAPTTTQQPSRSAPSTTTFQPQQAKPVEAVMPQAGVDEYGPVMANETLWPIALRTKPQGVSVKQMMIALQRKNPHAFIRENVNNLKRGSILRMPTQEEIDLISAREARNEFSNQVTEWKAYRAALAGDVAPSSEAAASKKAPKPDSKLKLASVRPEGEGKGGASEGDGSEEITSKLENELILAREQFESAKQERNDLSSQVSQLTDLESLLAVRNEQLARLQNELKQSQVDAAQIAEEAPMAEVAADVESETTEIAIDIAEESEELEIVDTEEVPVEAEVDKTEATDVAPKPQIAPAPTAPKAEPTESILDTLKGLFEDNMIAAAGGGLVILLLLLLLARRNKAESEEFEESILVGTQGEDTESLGSAGTDTEGVMSEAAETSFLSEFSHSDMDVLQDDTGEVDPVAE
ncbi:FimV/HubP family polar landmark protein, partial [Pseudomonadota bacterium]